MLGFLLLASSLSEKIYLKNFVVWAREGKDAITLTDLGDGSWKVTYTGTQDFAVSAWPNIPGILGDEISIGVTVNVKTGHVNTGIVPYDENNQALTWSAGSCSSTKTNIEETLTTSYIAPFHTKTLGLRLVGRGAMEFTFKEFWYDFTNHFDVPTDPISLRTETLEVILDPATQNLTVFDKTSQRTWTQISTASESVVISKGEQTEKHVQLTIRQAGIDFRVSLELNHDELNWSITTDPNCNIPPPIFPLPFVSRKGDRMLAPLYGGVSIPSDQAEIVTTNGVVNSLWFVQSQLSMSFVAITDEQASMMIVFDTPYDGSCAMLWSTQTGTYYFKPAFELEQGRFSYTRKLRFIFFAGGHVSVAKRYRKIASMRGILVPLAEKAKTNKYIDMLIGSVNVYALGGWDKNRTELYREMQSLGIERILSSQAVSSSEYVEEMNNNMSHVLSSRYDIYQDTSNPEYEEKGWIYWHGQWVREAYPDELIINDKHEFTTGWSVENLSNPGQMIYCYVLCDKKAPSYAVNRLEEEIASGYNYRSRFIDTTFASHYRECYHPEHSMTKSVSKEYRYKLLELFHKRSIVVGTEDGKDVAIPVADFFEGMMSPGPFRVPGSGRNLEEVFMVAPEAQVKVMLNESIRVPLFELAFHDCVVSYWYWCDHNAKVIPLWDRRDLFNRLYGTPPMFVFNQTIWERYKDRFAQSFKTAAPVSWRTGYAEMIDHVYLTSDYSVQRTVFSNGVRVTVNFGSADYVTENGEKIPPMDSLVDEVKSEEPDGGLPGVAVAFIVIFVIACVVGAVVGVLWFLKRRASGGGSIQNYSLHV